MTWRLHDRKDLHTDGFYKSEVLIVIPFTQSQSKCVRLMWSAGGQKPRSSFSWEPRACGSTHCVQLHVGPKTWELPAEFPGRGQLCSVGSGWVDFFKHMQKSQVPLSQWSWLFTGHHLLSMESGRLEHSQHCTPSTTGVGSHTEARMQAMCHSKGFYLCAVCAFLGYPPSMHSHVRAYVHTHTPQTLTHTHSLLSAHEAIKHTHP